MDESQKSDMMELSDLKEEVPDDDYQVQSQMTFGASIPGEEVITDDIPAAETVMPIPLKLLEVSTGKEVHYKDEFGMSAMDALCDPIQETAVPVPLKLVEVSTGIEVHYRPNFGVPDVGEESDPLQMDLTAVKEEPPDDEYETVNEEAFLSIKQEPEESLSDGNFADEVTYSPLHLAQTSFGNDNIPQMGFSLQKWKWKMSKILGNDLNETEGFKEERTESQEETNNEDMETRRGRLERCKLQNQERKQKEKLERQANLIARITEHIHLKRLGETEEERQERLRNMKTYAARRSNRTWKYVVTDKGDGVTSVVLEETEEERERRLELQRVRQARFRAKETPEEKERRLEKARLRTQRYRQKETPEKKEERRKKMRLYVALKRLRKGDDEGAGSKAEESETGSVESSLATGSTSASLASEETGESSNATGSGIVVSETAGESSRYVECAELGKIVPCETQEQREGSLERKKRKMLEETEKDRAELEEYMRMYAATKGMKKSDEEVDEDSDVRSERSSVVTTESTSGAVREANEYRQYMEELRQEKGIVCETPEQRDQRLEREKLKKRQRRAEETEEEREKRRWKMRLYKRMKRLRKGEEKDDEEEAVADGGGSELSSRRTSVETLPETEGRDRDEAEIEALRQAKGFAKETPEERDKRLETNRTRIRERRLSSIMDSRKREREYKRLYRLRKAGNTETTGENSKEEGETVTEGTTVIEKELEEIERLSRSILPETEEQRLRCLSQERESKAEKRGKFRETDEYRRYIEELRQKKGIVCETPEQRDQRLERERLRIRQKRAKETEEERDKHREKMRLYKRMKRLRKGEEKEEAVADDARSELSSRRTSVETLPDLEGRERERSELEALRQAKGIARETPEERDKRLEKNRTRIREKRLSGILDSRKREREYKRLYRLRKAGSTETIGENSKEEGEMLMEEAEINEKELEEIERLSRSIVPETEEQRLRRLSQDRERKAEKRAKETPEERSARLERMRSWWKERKQREVTLGKDAEKERERSLKNCRRARLKRETETPEERNKRLEGLKVAQRKYLANETPEKREKRLMNLKLLQAKRMASETKEQKEERLRRGREYYARRRAKEKDKGEGVIVSQEESEVAAVQGEQ